MEEEKRGQEKHRVPVWSCLLLFVVLFPIVLSMCGVWSEWLAVQFFRTEMGSGQMLMYIIGEAGSLLALLSVVCLLLWIERRPFADLGLSMKEGHARGWGYGALMAVVIYLIGFGLSVALGAVEVTGCRFLPMDLWLSWVFYLLVALFEETLVRGYILGRLLNMRLNRFLSLFLSSLVFGLLHLFNPEIGFLPLFNLVVAGMMLGASYLYTRNLCFPISLHLFWNWLQGPVLGYEVSGQLLSSSMLTLHLPEENLLNGGAFGFEGSLLCTVLMGGCTLLILRWGERKRQRLILEERLSC